MSDFGVKSPLRRAIVTDDFFFDGDVELADFLKKVHESDEWKYFKHILSDDIKVARKEEVVEWKETVVERVEW